MVSLLHRKKHSSEEEIARMLAEQTGDPAFALRTKWIEEYGNKNYAGALKILDEALEVSHGAPVYLALRAMTHVQLENRAEAAADVEAALAVDPTVKEALDVQKALAAFALESRDKARELAKAGDDGAAVDELTKAVEIEPGNAENWLVRGVLQAHAGNLDAATTDLERALELDPGKTQAREVLDALRSTQASELGTAEAWHCYVCSGNPSLIDSFHGLFAQAGVSEVRRAFVSNADIEAKRPKAREGGLAFAGEKRMGTSADEIPDLNTVLGSLGMQGNEGVHVCAVTVDAPRKAAVVSVYEDLLGQATAQGILPFPMFATTNEEAARFLDELLG